MRDFRRQGKNIFLRIKLKSMFDRQLQNPNRVAERGGCVTVNIAYKVFKILYNM